MKILDKSQINNSRHIARVIDNVNSFSESIDFFFNYANIKGTISLPEYDTKLL